MGLQVLDGWGVREAELSIPVRARTKNVIWLSIRHIQASKFANQLQL